MGTASKWALKMSLGAANRGVANATSANSSGAAVDLTDYTAPGGRQIKGILNVGTVTSTGYLAVKVQESSTSAEAGFADISGAAFTTTANAAKTGSEEIHFKATKRYIRALGTASDTAQVNYSVGFLVEKRLV